MEASSSSPFEIFPHLNFQFQKFWTETAFYKFLKGNRLVPNRSSKKGLALSKKELVLACIKPIDDGNTSRGDGLTSDGDRQIAYK